MIIVLGLVILVAAVIAGVAGVRACLMICVRRCR